MCVRLAENVSEKNRFVKIMVQQILDGVLQPGDRLPTESELAAQYGIAKTNVHLGLKEVARLGFLKIVPRHASYVTDIWSHITLDSLSAMVQYSADKPERTAVSAQVEAWAKQLDAQTEPGACLRAESALRRNGACGAGAGPDCVLVGAARVSGVHVHGD